MDADRFDSLLRAFSRTPSRRHALRVLAGTALGGLLGIEQLKTKAKKGKGGGKGGKKKCKNKGKITICHKGQTISVSGCAWKAHQKHGDTMGACPGQDPPPECATTDDCSDLTESCQGRQCRAVCSASACPGADCQCGVHHQADGTRSTVCYARLVTDQNPTPCTNDDDCGFAGFDTCVIAEGANNRVCAAVEPCSCTSNFDCPDPTTSCQGPEGGKTCQPVCQAGTCTGTGTCNCAVRQESDGDRSAVCYSAVDYGAGFPCGNDSNCSLPANSVCLVESDQTNCANTGFCANCGATTPCS